DHFGGAAKFPRIKEDMMRAVDQADAAQSSKDDILGPKGWTLLNYIMDPRTGLGRFREFRISNYQLMMELIDACLTKTVDEILQMPDVKERVDLYRAHEPKTKAPPLTGRTSRRRRSRSSAAPPFTGTSSSSTSATKSRSGRRTASPSTRS